MFTKFVRKKRLLNTINRYNSNTNKNINNGYIKEEEYLRGDNYNMIRANLNEINNKVNQSIVLSLPSFLISVLLLYTNM